MITITIDRKLLEEVVELFDSAITARHPHEILRDIRAALAAPATAPAQPAWHDVPTEPGTWILSLDSGMEVQENITQHEIDIEATWPGGRWYGPIPEDKL